MKIKFEEDVKLMEMRDVKPGDVIKCDGVFYLVCDLEADYDCRSATGIEEGDCIEISGGTKVEVFEGEVTLKQKA